MLQRRGNKIHKWEQQWTDSDWQRVFEIHKDRTGYEWFTNDLYISDFFQKRFYSYKEKVMVLSLGLKALDVLRKRLKETYKEDRFCLYLIVDEDGFTVSLRFHKYRKEEQYIWGKLEDIDEIQQPVLVITI